MNVKLSRKQKLSTFRKIAIGTWQTAHDPTVYGTVELRMDRALDYMAAFRVKTGKRVTVSHLAAMAIAAAFQETPSANAILRFNSLYLREGVGVFFQVAIVHDGPDGIDLSGFVMHEVEKKSLPEICDEFQQKVELVRTHKDAALAGTRKIMRLVPSFLLPLILRVTSFLAYTLNLNMSFFGVPKDAFGSVMITNVGSLGLDVAYPPLVHYARLPMLIALGAIHDAPVVENGAVVVGKTMKVNVTFDHRFIDGVHAAAMAKTLRAWFEQPFEHFDAVARESG
jgi:pyruvate/2-oxoglutarate dehydrogenase complex dihydrolipoamide acyltransferase (E2) component